MSVLEKVKINPQICGLELDFSGELYPEQSKTLQNFFNSKGNQLTWNNTYFGKTTIRFNETSKNTTSGLKFTQELSIKFPSNDGSRSDRIAIFRKVKFLRLLLSNNTSLVMGRNDYFQNKRPNLSFQSDITFTTVTFTTESIFAVGFVEIVDISGIANQLFPADIPITFINI